MTSQEEIISRALYVACKPTDFMFLSLLIAESSQCVCKKVGCIITVEDNVISMGYNGPPKNTPSCAERWPVGGCRNNPAGKSSPAIHAEVNAIVSALERHEDLTDAILYTTLAPCSSCAKLISRVGIGKVVYREFEFTEGLEFLRNAGIITERR